MTQLRALVEYAWCRLGLALDRLAERRTDEGYVPWSIRLLLIGSGVMLFLAGYSVGRYEGWVDGYASGYYRSLELQYLSDLP